MAEVILKPKETRRLQGGHLWIFSNEIQEVRDVGENGQLVAVRGTGGELLGRGYYNRHSLIAVRLLTRRQDEEIDSAFFRSRIARAIEYRRRLYPDSISGRLIYSESDLLPGLIVDRYESVLVLQVTTLGLERLLPICLPVLEELLRPTGIFLRNDSSLRLLEGLLQETKVLSGDVPDEMEISQHGLKFLVDVKSGQKTGFFFDQRENRERMRVKVALRGKRVLDCFCYTGAWALVAAQAGAQSVIGLDESNAAIVLAQKNAALNGLADRVTFRKAEVFSELRRLVSAGEKFDCVILDPPAFAKTRKDVAEAFKGYAEINRQAFKLLNPGGFLVTSSCSHHLSPEDFQSVLRRAAREARVQARLVAFGGQALDHPVLLAMPETAYLKCAILQVLP